MVLSVYGEWAAASLFAAAGPDRFRIQAWGLISLRVEGLYTWVWSPQIARYLPAGTPWVVWDGTSESAAQKARESPP